MKLKKGNPCNKCTKCCDYIALEIDKPEDKEDLDAVRWYLAHKNVVVFIDDEGDWIIQFFTRCEKLDKSGWCKIYKKRPHICNHHSSEDCDHYGSDYDHKVMWKKIEDFDKWLKKSKKYSKMYKK